MQYPIFPPLRKDEYRTLERSILRHGVKRPIVVDQNGKIIDGIHRSAICEKNGIYCPQVTRTFNSERDRRRFVYRTNLKHRRLKPHAWGQYFAKFLDELGIRRDYLKKKGLNERSLIAAAAKLVNTKTDTAQYRLKCAEQYLALPADLRKAVDESRMALVHAVHLARPANEPMPQKNREHNQKKRKGAKHFVTWWNEIMLQIGGIFYEFGEQYGNDMRLLLEEEGCDIDEVKRLHESTGYTLQNVQAVLDQILETGLIEFQDDEYLSEEES